MKKTLVALAALASVSAFAQSSVTIYGAVDAGYVNSTQNDGTNTVHKATTAGGNSYTSRLGFTGVEDLGAGQKAGFTYEVALSSLGADSANSGAFSTSQASGLRTGQVYVSDAKLGTVTAGYGMTARHVQAATLDVSGGANIAGNLMTAVGIGGAGTTSGATGGAYTNSDYALRANAVSWTSPTYNGLTAVYGHIFSDSQKVKNSDDSQATNGNARADLVAFNYAQGPLTVMGSLTRTTTDTAVAAASTLVCVTPSNGNITNPADKCASTEVQAGGTAAVAANATVKTNTIVGGIYDFGFAKVSAGMYNDKLQNINATNDGASDVLNRGYQIGIRGPIPGTKAELFTQMANGSYVKGGEAKEQRATMGRQFGAIYNFSKRTSAYALYGVQSRNQFDAANLLDSVYAVGLRHNF